MGRICIGIHVHAEPERLQATLESLRANTGCTADLLLLPDGPDPATQRVLAALGDLPQSGTEAPQGTPACFNRLAATTEAGVIVLLESGALVGPGWLERLLAALDADARNGLAGPSTNQAWNEQGLSVRHGSSPAEVAHAAAQVARRYGTAWRTLEPLYSLADFCYAVKREVVEAVGAADEGYGLGPCWEMDYNVRAARAGFRGVWVCGAYVYRSPFTARRRREEARRFDASKRRYQDKFCALRLRGARAGYASHCRGDACEHFAPAGLIQVRLSLPIVATPLPAPAPASPAAPPAVTGAGAVPLVSCIMPTRDRPDFVRQAIHYFQRQDYPNRELILVDDSREALAQVLPADPRIRCIPVRTGMSIGEKRNRACEAARGALIAQWDDDDWYAPDRLSVQTAPLLSGEADISGLTGTIFFDLPGWRFWRCSPELHRRLFVEDVHGGTLVYWRRVWRQHARYPDASLAEDAALLRRALRSGARLARLPNDGRFIYLRHAGNSWAFACGRHVDPKGWIPEAEPAFLAEDRAFYAARRTAGSAGPCPGAPAPAATLVSCIMPTSNRHRFVPQAIHYFQRQDYPNRELILVDDGTEPVGELVPEASHIHYLRLQRRHTIGEKRNVACEAARGEVIVHWDDDDWSAPWRLRYQVAQLRQAGADLCGLRDPLFYLPLTDQSWQYVYPPGHRAWVYGATLCYTKERWRRNPFPGIDLGEDTRFVWSSRSDRVLALPDRTFFVGLIHAGNSSPKQTGGHRWRLLPGQESRRLLAQDLDFYRTPGRPPA